MYRRLRSRKKLTVDARSRVTGHLKEEGSVLAGTQTGECLGFEIELDIRSEASETEIRELIRMAHQICFTGHAAANPMPVQTRHLLNGSELLDS